MLLVANTACVKKKVHDQQLGIAIARVGAGITPLFLASFFETQRPMFFRFLKY